MLFIKENDSFIGLKWYSRKTIASAVVDLNLAQACMWDSLPMTC